MEAFLVKNDKIFVLSGLMAIILVGITVYKLKDKNFWVKFDTDGGNKIETQIIDKGKKVDRPEDPKKDGYVFVEWQLDGKAYVFSSKVNENITLKAKWMPEIYVRITFNNDDGSLIDTKEVLSGSKIDKDIIVKPTKEGYKFVGWYIKKEKYDFNKKVTTNMVLTAKWVEGEDIEISDDEKEIKKVVEEVTEESVKELNNKEDSNTSKYEFKVGDKVIITGSYAISSDGEVDGYDKAIGWEREIIAIYEDEVYQYQVGDSTGTTGFFKAEDLKLKG